MEKKGQRAVLGNFVIKHFDGEKKTEQ